MVLPVRQDDVRFTLRANTASMVQHGQQGVLSFDFPPPWLPDQRTVKSYSGTPLPRVRRYLGLTLRLPGSAYGPSSSRLIDHRFCTSSTYSNTVQRAKIGADDQSFHALRWLVTFPMLTDATPPSLVLEISPSSSI